MDILLEKNLSSSDLVILPLFKEEKLGAVSKQRLKLQIPASAETDFKNSLGETQLIYTDAERVMLLGLGEKRKFNPMAWRVGVHSAVTSVQKLGIPSAALLLPNTPLTASAKYLELTGFAINFSQYQFDWYRKDKKASTLTRFTVIAPTTKANLNALANGINIGHAANTARSLANHPANIATPTHLAQHALDLAKKYQFTCKVLGPKEIQQEKMGLVIGVASGSEEPSRFIVLEYLPAGRQAAKKKDPIILIGKGLTFDSGGISIKPAEKMEEMKFDMCGGATVLGIFEAVAQLKLPVHIVGLIPSTENLVSGRAIKPGDVLIAHDQTSVEIINTDAEGRLVLADALSYAQKYYKPQLMIDYATLTGAVVVALGDQYTGYFANTKVYDTKFTAAAGATSEQLWPLPLAAEYKDQLKSLIADIKNIGERGSAGSTTAALFLEHFVKNNTPWVHFDIAGTAWSMRPRPHAAPGATAWGVYLTVEFLRNIKS